MAKPFSRQAKALLQASLADGQISAQRLTMILDIIANSKIAHKAAILKQYQRQVELWQQRHQATIVSAAELTKANKDLVTKTVRTNYPDITEFAWHQDQNLIGGITVQVGDIWHDLSIRGGLNTIREHLRQ